MSAAEEALLRLPSQELEVILSEIQRQRERSRRGDPLKVPGITLLLESGHTVTGDLIHFGDSRTILMRTGNGLDATYVPLEAVRSLTVHLVPQNVHLLSFGGVAPVSEGPVPGRLEIEREMRALGERLRERIGRDMETAIAWDELPRNDLSLSTLGRLVNDLGASLAACCSDDLGLASLRDNVRAVRIASTAGGPSVSLEGDTLSVRVQVEGDAVLALRRPDLQAAVEKCL